MRLLFIPLALLLGCTGTPLPQPPSVEVNTEAIVIDPDPDEPEPWSIVRGLEGAASPGARVLLVRTVRRITALVDAADDGSFETRIEGPPDEPVRLHATLGDATPVILDLVAPAEGGAAQPWANPFACFGIAPTLYDFGPIAPGDSDSARVTVTNGCDAAHEVRAGHVLDALDPGTTEFVVGGLGVVVDPDGTATLDLTFEPDEPGAHHGSLQLDIDAFAGSVSAVARAVAE